MSHWLRELYAQKAAPAWSCLVATLNDYALIAAVLICLIGLLVPAGRMRWNEWYVATHIDGIQRPGQVVAGSRGDAGLQARSMIDANGSTRLQTVTPHRLYSNSSTAPRRSRTGELMPGLGLNENRRFSGLCQLPPAADMPLDELM